MKLSLLVNGSRPSNPPHGRSIGARFDSGGISAGRVFVYGIREWFKIFFETITSEAIAPYPAPPSAMTLVLLRLAWRAGSLTRFGGQWLPERKLWRIPKSAVKELGLENRVVEDG